MKVTIIGGGNLGTLMAATFAHRGMRLPSGLPSLRSSQRNSKHTIKKISWFTKER